MNRKTFLARAALAATLLFTGASSFAQQPPSGDCWDPVCQPSKSSDALGKPERNPLNLPPPDRMGGPKADNAWRDLQDTRRKAHKTVMCANSNRKNLAKCGL